jgi:hypothetical protein
MRSERIPTAYNIPAMAETVAPIRKVESYIDLELDKVISEEIARSEKQYPKLVKGATYFIAKNQIEALAVVLISIGKGFLEHDIAQSHLRTFSKEEKAVLQRMRGQSLDELTLRFEHH